ncbi:MAG: D-glycero-beta-D-manno-heptose-7-phosphate kinase [Elusimicrobia bacterium]|nr:D-glycero-beta-D-manno-heptose-7-phosphate kinase [Elusimicrobiota bacterium]
MKKNISYYHKIIDQFSKTKILVIGDLMVDRFIRGKVSRISPEAPVPVVKVKEKNDVPGGAGNVTKNLSSLGAKVECCGVIGIDPVGENLLNEFQRLQIGTKWIVKDPDRSTIVKSRVIAEHQQVVRFDDEDDSQLSLILQNEIQGSLKRIIKDMDGIILSDYGKGMITKAILKSTILQARHYKKPICVDPKIEHFLSYKNVTCITPNIQEALGGMHRLKLNSNGGLISLGEEILQKLKCRSVLITQGEEGMTLFEKNKFTHIPAKAQEVFDVTGAGDTVIAVLTLSLACNAPLIEAARLANLAAGIVIGKLGTAAVTPDELKDALKLL